MLGAEASPSARYDTAIMRHKALQGSDVFVVDIVNLVDTKVAMFVSSIFGSVAIGNHNII